MVEYRSGIASRMYRLTNAPNDDWSLRHTYISMRLMEGANIYQIAKNCRTSVGVIEKYYGVHVKNSLNAAAINVFRSGKDVMAEEFE